MTFADAKTVRPPLPGPDRAPVRASERLAILRERRPRLTGDEQERVRVALRKRYGDDFWKAKARKLEVRRSLKAFVQDAWHVIEPGVDLIWNWHLDVLCDALEAVTRGEKRKLIINVPPGCMKSRLVSVCWPAWIWLENPGWRSIFASYGAFLSNRDSRDCRTLVESEWYRAQIPAVYGDRWNAPWELQHDANNVQLYKTTLQGWRLATSVDGAGTGLRGDAVVIDDPHNVNERVTAEELEKVSSWFDKRMSSRLNDMQTGRFVIIMQRLYEHDLVGHLLAKDAANKSNPQWEPWEVIRLPSEYDPDKPNPYDRRTERGELLFPARFPEAVLEQAKVDLGAMYSAQHDQDPVPAGGGIVPMASLGFWYPAKAPDGWSAAWPPPPHMEKLADGTAVPCKQGPLPEALGLEIQSWDCTFKDTSKSDYVAGQHWAQGAIPRATSLFLLELCWKRMGLRATIDAVRDMRSRHPRTIGVLVEDAANGPGVVETLQDEIFGLELVPAKRGKEERAWAVEPLIRAGNVWLPHPALYRWVVPLLNELRAFPKGRHDDQVDSFTMALQRLSQSTRGASRLQALSTAMAHRAILGR